MDTMEKKKEHKRCGTCKCYRLPEDFLNITGRVLKLCVKCRAFSKIQNDKKKLKKTTNKNNDIIENIKIVITDVENDYKEQCELLRRLLNELGVDDDKIKKYKNGHLKIVP